MNNQNPKPKIPDYIIEEIKSRVKIEQFLTPSRKGGKDKYVCPFCDSGNHGGRNSDGALHVYKDKNSFFCFKCHEGGDVISFYRKLKAKEHIELDFVEAVKELAYMTNITIPEENNKPSSICPPPKAVEAPNPAPAQTEEPALDFTAYYKECAKRIFDEQSEIARDYFADRGLTLTEENPFWIGFDGEADPAFNPPKNPYHHPAPRLIIPITKDYYLARRVDGKTDKDDYPKLYPAGGKAAVWNEKAVGKPDNTVIFVCEGIFDALSAIETGYQAIATNSTANIPMFISKLKFNPPVDKVFVLSFDHDKAGIGATEDMIKALSEMDISFTVAPDEMYNGKKDLNEALCADREAFFIAAENAANAALQKKERDDDPWNCWNRREEVWEDMLAYRDSLTPTGIPEFDEALGGGIYAGLYLLAGVPGTGKTALAIQLSTGFAKSGRRTLFYELEMKHRDLKSRLVSHSLNEEYIKNGEFDKIRSAHWIKTKFTKEQMDEADAKTEELQKNISFVDNSSFKDIDALVASVERYVRRHPREKVPVLVVDYFQRLHTENKNSRYDELAYVLDRLMDLRNKYNMPILIISSMSRANYHLPASTAAAKETGDAEYACEGIFVLLLTSADEGELIGDGKSQKKDETEGRNRFAQEMKQKVRDMHLTCTKNRNGSAFWNISFDYYAGADYFAVRSSSYKKQQEEDQKKPASVKYEDIFDEEELPPASSHNDDTTKKARKPKPPTEKELKDREARDRMGALIRGEAPAPAKLTDAEKKIPNFNIPSQAEMNDDEDVPF